MGKLQHVAALEAVLNCEIDLRRVLCVSAAVGTEGALRCLMGLCCKPMNRAQLKWTAGKSVADVAGVIRAIKAVGFAVDVGRDDAGEVYAITQKGRRFLVTMIEASGPGDEDTSLRDLIEPVRMRRAEKTAAAS